MALSRLKYNSLNITPTASKGIGFDSGADDLAATFSGGSMTFIKKLTASSSATLDFVGGASGVVLDGTYKEYVFTFKDIHPQTDGVKLTFNLSIDTGSNYNVTKTATNFYAGHTEADATGFGYSGGLAQSTSNAFITVGEIGSAADESCSGEMFLYAPSDTTFVKHWTSVCTIYGSTPQSQVTYGAGYGNTTSAVDAIQFKFDSGNIDAGDICLYGIN